jgi:L-amino acid N-acyltransferase YncA
MNPCRLASLEDAPAIQGIYAPIVRDTPISFEYDVPTVSEMERRIAEVLQRRPWLVYEEGGQVLGYAYARTFRERKAYDWGVEAGIYVDGSAQKRGIGQQLYSVLFDVLRALNYCQVWASATVPNESSERLHARMGFEFVGKFPKAGYKFGRWHDSVFWRRALREFPEQPEAIGNVNDLVKAAEWAWLKRS